MSDINQVWLSGRLTKNPELRHTPSGVAVCDMIIASNRYGKLNTDGERQQYTAFVRVTVWNKQAEVLAEMLHTGDHIGVVGQLFDDNFEQEREDGTKLKTSGRLKVDNANVTIFNRKTSGDTAKDSEETPEV
jgi:single-strand DNA-binding protein